ncbi:MAG: helix-turn-helix transcriptional regulator [Alphaproteobacteria bacterium]
MARRADRLFEIIQILRAAGRPLTAAEIAERLEVTARTVYRDIADLQAHRIPIEGAAGIGYVMRPGFELPPLMLTIEEMEAIVTGISLLTRVRDPVLKLAASSVLEKVKAVVPPDLRPHIDYPALFVSDGSAAEPEGVEPADLRRAIRTGRKLRVRYVDAGGQASERTLWPIAVLYYVDATLIAAWCELRRDFRHFRIERITACEILAERYPESRRRLLAAWRAYEASRPRELSPPP